LDPTNAEAHHLQGAALGFLGDDLASATALQRALEIDPERAITLLQLAALHHVARRYGDAQGLLDSALVVDPDFVLAYGFRARVRLRLDDRAGARADAKTIEQMASAEGLGSQWLAELAWVLVESAEGDTTAARARALRLVKPALTWIQASKRQANLIFGNMAPPMALAAVGETDRALDLLELYTQNGRLHYYLSFPEFDALRDHPRFQRLIKDSRMK
jgi:tetratricopeptide (TPR) repeat protein